MNKIKIVRYNGSLDPIYEEVGEIEIKKELIGRFANEEEFCIDINDLIDFMNRKRS
jgi:hypothetical protein